MILKLFLIVALLGFVGIGILLFTNHPGFAIKICNYLFFVILITLFYEKFIKK